MKVFINPRSLPERKLSSGIEVVNFNMQKYLPTIGVEIVSTPEDADIVATHVCSPGDANYDVDVVHIHGLYPTHIYPEESWTWHINKNVVQTIRSSWAVTVPSKWVAEIFERDMGFSPFVIPHGINSDNWYKKKAESIEKHTVLWNKNRDTDVCFANHVNEIAKVLPDVDFITTFGKEAQNVDVIGNIKRIRMRDIVHFSSIYLATTKETFGVGILEALAAGNPVLSWDWGAVPDIVEHKKNGYIVSPGDYEGTVDGIKYIIDNYKELSFNARERAKDFNWISSVLQYKTVYEEALRKKNSSHRGKATIVIPCYNYARFVGDAIDSVKKQTYDNFDCIIVDDGSTDDSVRVINECINGDKRFTVIQKENSGVAHTRNVGAMNASGDFISFLDADDVMQPNFLSDLVPHIKDDPSMGVVYGRLSLMNEQGVVTTVKSDWPGAQHDPNMQLDGKNRIPSCCLIRKEAFLRAGGYRQHLAPVEDAELWTRIPLIGYNCSLATDDTVYTYRLHNKSESAKVRGGKEPNWRAFIPCANGGRIPFASTTAPKNDISHPVTNFDEPLLSFIIPVYDNHLTLLQDALESIAGQVGDRWEIVVVDDTKEGIAKDFGSVPYRIAYPYVKWIRNDKIGNVSRARNVGTKASRGKYICFLDADDYILPEFFTTMVPLMHKDKDYSKIFYTDWVEKPEGKVHKAENWDAKRIFDHALFAVTFVHPRCAFDFIGGFDEELALWEDWDYVIRLSSAGYIGIRIPKPLFAYRYDTGMRRETSLLNKNELIETIHKKNKFTMPTKKCG